MTLAAVLAIDSYYIIWWLPAIIFPVWILASKVSHLDYYDRINRGRIYAMRWYFYILATAYIIAQTVIFQIHMGSLGWLLGLLIGWIASGMVAGKLEPKLLHRELL